MSDSLGKGTSIAVGQESLTSDASKKETAAENRKRGREAGDEASAEAPSSQGKSNKSSDDPPAATTDPIAVARAIPKGQTVEHCQELREDILNCFIRGLKARKLGRANSKRIADAVGSSDDRPRQLIQFIKGGGGTEEQLEDVLDNILPDLGLCVKVAHTSSTNSKERYSSEKVALDEWFAENKIPEALKKALYEDGFDTEETLAKLTEDNLQSYCDAASVRLTPGLKIKFQESTERMAMTGSRLNAMRSATAEMNELRKMHSQGYINDEEQEVKRRLILASYGITSNPGEPVAPSNPAPHAPAPATVSKRSIGAHVDIPSSDAFEPTLKPLSGKWWTQATEIGYSEPNRFDGPYGLTTLPDSGHVVVWNQRSLRLQVVNLTDGSFVRSMCIGGGPCGVTTLPNGHVVVCDYSKNVLHVVDPDDGTIIRSLFGERREGEVEPDRFNSPSGVAALPNGHVVVCDRTNNRLQVIDPDDGSVIRSIGNGQGSGPNQFYYPSGVTTLAYGLVVVCDYGNSRLQVVDPSDGSFVRSIGGREGSGADRLIWPHGVTALPNGHVVVCDRNNHRLQVVNPSDGTFVRSIDNGYGRAPKQFNTPSAVATLPNGHVVVCDEYNNRLQVVDPSDGSFVRSFDGSSN